MFTGLVEDLGIVRSLADEGAGRSLTIATAFASDVTVGESIAVNGVCLTVVAHDVAVTRFQVSPETLARTNLGLLQPHDPVNLERAVRLGDRLGGHFVQGHVDGLATMGERLPEGQWETIWFRCTPSLLSYIVPKGSVAVDGVSLTPVTVLSDRFSVALIPHTLAHTTLGCKQAGALVNIETDLLAKYVARHFEAMQLPSAGTPLDRGRAGNAT